MRLSYLFDPLCGWCYGAIPALEEIIRQTGAHLELAPTGLFADDGGRPMDAHFAAFAWENDQRIARLSGQSFTTAYRDQLLQPPYGVFDSGVATLAVVATAMADPSQELAVLKLIQQARYVNGRDTSSPEIIAAILAEAGQSAVADRISKPDQALIDRYHERIADARQTMQRLGARGVPTLVIGEAEQRRVANSNMLFGDLTALISQLRAA